MRIGIDCRTILNPQKGEQGGIGHYTYQLVRHLLKQGDGDTFVLFFDRSVQDKHLEKFDKDNVEIKFFPFIKYEKFMPEKYVDFLTSATVNSKNVDVFFSPIPRIPSSYKGKSVVTVHDLALLEFPDLFSDRELSKLKNQIPDALDGANKIISVSDFTAEEIEKNFDISSEKIKVISNGVDRRFFNEVPESEIKEVANKFDIEDDYILFLGTLDPRKNIARLIDAYEYFRDNFCKKNGYKLVLAGAKGNETVRIERKIEFSDYKEDIILPGYVSAENLGGLFKGASIFVFPSLYEGFGIPPLEAMAKGIPTVVSNINPIKKVVGEDILKFDPKDSKDIAKKIKKILENDSLRKETVKKGIERAKQFSWKDCAKKTLKVLHKIKK